MATVRPPRKGPMQRQRRSEYRLGSYCGMDGTCATAGCDASTSNKVTPDTIVAITFLMGTGSSAELRRIARAQAPGNVVLRAAFQRKRALSPSSRVSNSAQQTSYQPCDARQ